MTETKIEDNIAAAYEWAQSHKPPHPRVGIKFEDFREAFLMLRCPMALSLAESEGVEMLNVFVTERQTTISRTIIWMVWLAVVTRRILQRVTRYLRKPI